MTKIKFCGLTRDEDIAAANELMPDYIGFVFWQKSKRNISLDKAKKLKELLLPDIKAVGVFVDEDVKIIAKYLSDGIIDIAQLHGSEDDDYIDRLRVLTDKKYQIIKAFKIKNEEDVKKANNSTSDYVLLDAGMGEGCTFNWTYLDKIERPYFLAGGLDTGNVREAVSAHIPFAVDVSSGIETNGKKDADKMRKFVEEVRGKLQ